MDWWRGSKVKITKGVRLAGYTTFKIGGPAEFFSQPRDEAELKLLINLAKRYKIKLLVIGAGSNILAADRGVRAMVVRLTTPYFRRISARGNFVFVRAGCLTGRLLDFCSRRNLAGLEFLAGIPGTLGGCLAMNAGAWGDSLAKKVFSCLVMERNGRIKTLKKGKIKFAYRSSSLEDYIILEACLKLDKEDGSQINQRIKRFVCQRRATQDLTRPSAGCVFKNPPGDSAGRLIDACGLKGKTIGGAAISARHANFLINIGKAKFSDVLRLMGLIKKTVRQKFNVGLEPEIKIWQ